MTESAAEIMKRVPVVIESPLRGDIDRNLRYLRAAMRDSLLVHREAPFASVELYHRVLNDQVEHERELGMNAGFLWALKTAQRAAVYEDLGVSDGMKRGIHIWSQAGIQIEFRKLGEGWDVGPRVSKPAETTCVGCARFRRVDLKTYCGEGMEIPASYRFASQVPSWCPARYGTPREE